MSATLSFPEHIRAKVLEAFRESKGARLLRVATDLLRSRRQSAERLARIHPVTVEEALRCLDARDGSYLEAEAIILRSRMLGIPLSEAAIQIALEGP